MQRLCRISHTEAYRVRSRRTLADAKESESSRAVGAEIGSIAKMTVELRQPTAVMQQEPSPSSSFSPTALMQEPTQNIQNEQMDSPMEMGAQEHREQKGVQLSETLPSEMFKRPVVKAKPVRSSMITPMMERLGSAVLLDPVPSSKEETTTGSLHAIDGVDVVTALVSRGGCVAVRGDENVREKNSVSGRRTGISCDCEPRGSQRPQDHQRLRSKKRVKCSTQKKCGKEKPERCKSLMSSKSK